MPADFTPIPPPGFDIAGTFNGVTTAVGQGGVPRIRYQISGIPFRGRGLGAWAMRQVMNAGAGDEVALGSLHSRLATALALVGGDPEVGMTQRLDDNRPDGFVLGRYKDRTSGAARFGAMALVKSKAGLIEVLVTECETEDAARDLAGAAMAPYR